MPQQWFSHRSRIAGMTAGWAATALFAAILLAPAHATAQEPVFCVLQRTVAGGPSVTQFSVVRCDQVAGAGPGFTVVASNLTFAAADALRASLSAGAAAPIWCVVQRQVPVGGQTGTQFAVVRCDQVAGAGPGWTMVESGLTFAAAIAARAALDAGSGMAIWCVVQRQVPVGGGQTATQFSVVRCDQVAGAGPGWTVVASNLTFAAAAALRTSLSAGAAPPIFCVLRRQAPVATPSSPIPTGPSQFSVVRCDQVAGAGPGWVVVDRNLTFAAASAAATALAATVLASPAPPIGGDPTPSQGCREIQKMNQPEQRDQTGRITVEASIIHVILCGSEQFYIYQYVNRPGFRAIRPPNWGAPLGGGDFKSFDDAVRAARTSQPTVSTPRPTPAQPGPGPAQPGQPPASRPTGCALAGSWEQTSERIGSSIWSISNTGRATESGLGNSTGTASLTGTTLRIDWTNPNGWSGVYQWNLGADCTSGRGTLTFKSGGSGTRTSSVTRR